MTSQSCRSSGITYLLLLILGFVLGFVVRPVYERHYGQPSTEKLGAQVGRSIDKAIGKTGDALEKTGDKIERKIDEVRQ